MSTYDTSLYDDFITTYTNVVLLNLPNYHTTIKVNNVTLIMYVNYNARSKQRSISLETLDGYVLLPKTFVKQGRRCELNFNAELEGLDYYVTLRPLNEGKTFADGYDYLNWSDDFSLCFVGYDYSLTERLNRNIRIAFVGN